MPPISEAGASRIATTSIQHDDPSINGSSTPYGPASFAPQPLSQHHTQPTTISGFEASKASSTPLAPAWQAAHTSTSKLLSALPPSSATAPSFVSKPHIDATSDRSTTSTSTTSIRSVGTAALDSVIVGQIGQLSPRAKQRRQFAAAQNSQATSSSQPAWRVDPYLQTLPAGEFGAAAAFRPPSPSSAPGLTLSYGSRPEPKHYPSFAALVASLPRRSQLVQSQASDSTPAPSSVSTYPSSPQLSEPHNLAASSITEATSATAADSVTSTSTPQITSPKINAWGTPKSWADTLGRGGIGAKGPIGVSVNVGAEASAGSEFGSPSLSRSPKAANGKKSSRKSGASQNKPAIMSLKRLLSDAHTRFDAPVTHPRGLVNKGNFCFANAILQTLVYCAPFYNLFSLIGREVPADFGNATPLMEAVIHFLREFLPTDAANGIIDSPLPGQDASLTAASEPFLPEFVYDAMRLNKRFDQMRRGHQEDAEEFLGFFLDTLHEELISAQHRSAVKIAQLAGGPNGLLSRMSEEEKKLNGVSNEDLRRLGVQMTKDGLSGDAVGLGLDAALDEDEIIEREVMRPVSPSEEGWMEVGQKGKTAYTRTTSTSESPITRIFGGKLRSVLKTPGAKDSVTLEPYQPLQLDIQPAHVQSIEDALLNLTEPETIPGVWSPSRGAEVDATKQVFIESLPPVLVLHLKRFIYDEIGGVQKSQKPLSYGTTLEIAPEVLSPTMRSQPRPRYRLFGIVYHHGRYASGGHYTVDVLRQDGQAWLHIDDTLFHTVPTEHVIRNAASPNRNYGHDGLAYLLFYRRELPGESEAEAKAKANGTVNHQAASTSASAKAGQAAAAAAGGVLVNGARSSFPQTAAAETAAVGGTTKSKKQQHKTMAGAGAAKSRNTPPANSNSAASSPRAAPAAQASSPKPQPAVNNTKPAKKIVPGWDR